jgi:hypothetical protein
MDERGWELYRLSVLQLMSDCPLKEALIRAAEHKLEILAQQEDARPPNPFNAR